MKVIVSVLLLSVVILLTYMCYSSLMLPINFDKERKAIEAGIISRLIDIRKAQIEYKNIHREHAGNFDQLAEFLNNEKLPYLRKEGTLTDEQLEAGMTEQEAVKKGIIRRDTFWILAKDTLFGAGYNVADLKFVPNVSKADGSPLQFFMDTATIVSASGYTVKVFEASVLYDDYLRDLDRQSVVNMNEVAKTLNRFPGLRVGSLEEINNNAGNWENQ